MRIGVNRPADAADGLWSAGTLVARYHILEILYVASITLFLLVGVRKVQIFFYAAMVLPFLLLHDHRHLRSLASTPLLRLTALFLGYLWLSIFWSDIHAVGRTLEEAGKIINVLFFIYVTAALHLERPAMLDRLSQAFVTVAAVTGAGLIAWYVMSDPTIKDRLIGLGAAGHAIIGATLYGIAALMIIFHLWPRAGNTGAQAALALGFAICISFMVLTQSRGPFVGLVAVMIAGILTISGPVRRVVLIGFGMTALVAAIMLAMGTIDFDLLIMRGSSKRLIVWQQSWEAISRHPWFGIGLTTPLEFEVGEKIIHFPHNIWLLNQVLGGTVASALLLMLVGQAVRTFWQVRRNQGIMLMGMLLVFGLTIGMFDFRLVPRNINIEYIFFWMPIAILAAESVRKPDDP